MVPVCPEPERREEGVGWEPSDCTVAPRLGRVVTCGTALSRRRPASLFLPHSSFLECSLSLCPAVMGAQLSPQLHALPRGSFLGTPEEP